MFQIIMLKIVFISCLVTFLLYGIDKHLAVYEKRRVPEWMMLFLAFWGGALGALCAMIFFRHKISKSLFMAFVPICMFIQLAILVLCRLEIIA